MGPGTGLSARKDMGQWMEVLLDADGVPICEDTDACENSTFPIPSERGP